MLQADIPAIDATALESRLRRVLGEPAARLRDGWRCEALEGGAGGALGVYRLTGTVSVGPGPRPWSLVLKICAPDDEGSADAWVYPGREARAFRAGFLTDLPGLAAPACHEVETGPDGTIRLWLEYLTDDAPGQWPPERHAFAATCLGRFNGAFLAGRPMPTDPWLTNRALHTRLDDMGPTIASLATLARPDGHPLVRRFYPPAVLAALDGLWADRHAFLNALERLPQTVCHRDPHRRNMFIRRETNGDRLVLIDWALCGISAVGEDLAGMVMGNLLWFEQERLSPADADALCFAAYLDGLREAGWHGDPRLARLGYLVAACMVHMLGYDPNAAAGLGTPEAHPVIERIFARPVEDVVARHAAETWPFKLALVAEARALLREMA
jgi:hypothetical protein